MIACRVKFKTIKIQITLRNLIVGLWFNYYTGFSFKNFIARGIDRANRYNSIYSIVNYSISWNIGLTSNEIPSHNFISRYTALTYWINIEIVYTSFNNPVSRSVGKFRRCCSLGCSRYCSDCWNDHPLILLNWSWCSKWINCWLCGDDLRWISDWSSINRISEIYNKGTGCWI